MCNLDARQQFYNHVSSHDEITWAQYAHPTSHLEFYGPDLMGRVNWYNAPHKIQFYDGNVCVAIKNPQESHHLPSGYRPHPLDGYNGWIIWSKHCEDPIEAADWAWDILRAAFVHDEENQ